MLTESGNKDGKNVKYCKLVNHDLTENVCQTTYLRNFEIHGHYTRGISTLLILKID